MSDSIHVAVRVRPLIQRENKSLSGIYWKVEDKNIIQIDEKGRPFCQPHTYDHVFDMTRSTCEVYDNIASPIIRGAMEGFNGTIFAYGQTSSGKTHTMMGSDAEPGVIPKAINEIFEYIDMVADREFLLRVSYMEIYNENISDLLSSEKKSLKVHENADKKVYVNGLSEEFVSDSGSIFALMKKGDALRRVGETNMNERSSRSHTIFRVIIESRERNTDTRKSGDGAVNVAHLNLVDLAGSERASQTGATGERLKEGCSINKSLFMLGHVISKLSEGEQFVNYRDSKLTRILQNSLGGNSKTAIVCTVTPAAVEETISTLKFATRAKTIENKPTVNEVLTDEALLSRMRKELSQLKKQLKDNDSTEKEDLQMKLEEKEKTEQELQGQIERLMKYICVSTAPSEPLEKPKKKLRRETWCPGNALSRNPLESARTLKMELSASPRTSLQLGRIQPLQPIAERSFSCSSNTGLKRKSSSGESGCSDSAFETIHEDFVAELDAAQAEKVADGSLERRKKRRLVQFDLPAPMSLGETTDIACQTEVGVSSAIDDLATRELQTQVDAKDEEIHMLVTAMNEVQHELAEKNEETACFEEKIKTLSERNQELEVLTSQRGDNSVDPAQFEELKCEVETLREVNQDLEDRFSQIFEDCEERKEKEAQLTSKLAESEDVIAKLKSQHSSSGETCDETELEMLRQLTEDLHEKVFNYETEISMLKGPKESESERDSSSGLRELIEVLNAKIVEQQLEIESLQEINSHMDSKLKEASSSGELTGIDAKQAEDMRLEIDTLKDLMSEYERQLEQKSKDDHSLQEKATFFESQLGDTMNLCEQMSMQKSAMEEEAKGLRQEMVNLKAKCEDLEDQFQKKEEELKELEEFTRLEAEIKESRSDDEGDDKQEQYKHRIKQLEDLLKHSEQSSQEIEEQYQSEIQSLQKKIESMSKGLHQLEEEKIAEGHSFEESPEEELRHQVASLKKTEQDAEVVLLDVNRALAEKTDENADLQKRLAELETNAKKMENDKADFDSFLELERQNRHKNEAELRSQLQDSYKENGELQAKLGEDSTERETLLQSEVENLQTELTTLRAEIDSLNEKLTQSQIDLEEAVSKSLEAEQSLPVVNELDVATFEEPEEFGEEVDMTVSEPLKMLDSTQPEVLSLEAELQAAQANVSVFSEDGVEVVTESNNEVVEVLQKTIADLQEQLETSKINCQELEACKLQLEQTVEQLQAKVSELEVAQMEHKTMSEEICEIKAELEMTTRAKDELLANVAKWQESATEAELKFTELSTKYEDSQRDLQLTMNELSIKPADSSSDSKLLEQLLNEEKKAHRLLRESYEKLTTETCQTKGKLLSEANRDLGHQRHIEEQEKALKDLQNNFSQTKKENDKLIDSLNKKVYELQCQLQKADGERELAVHQNMKSLEKLETLKQEVRDLENLHSQHTKSVGRQEMDPQKLLQRIKQLEFNLDLTKQKSDKFQQQAKSLNDIENKLDNAQFARNDLQRQVRDLQRNLDLQKEQHQQLMSRFNMSTSQYTNLQQHTNSLQDEIKKSTQNYERAMSEKSELNMRVEELTQKLEHAKSDSSGHDASVAVMRKQLTKTTEELEDTKLECDHMKGLSKSLEADLSETKALLQRSETSCREQESNLCKLKKDLATKTEQIENLQSQCQEQTQHLSEISARLTDVESKLEQSHCDGRQLESEISVLKKDLVVKTEQLEEAQSSNGDNDSKVCDLMTKVSEVESELSEKSSQLSRIQQELSAKSGQVSEMELAISQFESSVTEKDTSLNEKSSRIFSMEERITEQSNTIAQLNEKLSLLSESAAGNDHELSLKLDEQKKDLDDKTTTISQLEQMLSESTDQCVHIEQERGSLELRVAALESEVSDKIMQIEELSMKANEVDNLLKVEDENCSLKTDLESSNCELRKKEFELQRLSCDVEDGQRKMAEMEQALKDAIQDTKSQVQEADDAVQRISRERNSSQKEVEKLKQECESLQSQVVQLNESLEMLQKSQVSEDVLTDLKKTHAAELARAVHDEEQRQVAIFKAEKDQINHERSQVYERQIAVIRDQSCDKMKEIEDEMKAQFTKKIRLLEEDKAKLLTDKTNAEERAAIIEAKDGNMCEALAEAELKVESYKNQIADVEKTVAFLEEQLSGAVNKLEEAEEAKYQQSQEFDEIKAQGKAMIEKLQAQLQATSSETEVESLKKDLAVTKAQLDAAEKSAEQKDSMWKKEIQHLQNCCEESDKELDAETQALEEARQTIKDLQSKLDAKAATPKDNKEHTTSKKEFDLLKAQLAEKEQALEDEIKARKEEVEFLRKCCDEADAEGQRDHIALAKLQDEYKKLSTGVNSDRTNYKSSQGEYKKIIAENELKINELQTKLILAVDPYQKKIQNLLEDNKMKEARLLQYKNQVRKLQQSNEENTTVCIKPAATIQPAEPQSSGGVATSVNLWAMDAQKSKLERDMKAMRARLEKQDAQLANYKSDKNAAIAKMKALHQENESLKLKCKSVMKDTAPRPALHGISNSPMASPVKKAAIKTEPSNFNDWFSEGFTASNEDEEPQVCKQQ